MNTPVKRTLALCILAAFCGAPSLAGPGDGGIPAICLDTPFFDGPPVIGFCTRPSAPPIRTPIESALDPICPHTTFLNSRFSSRPCPSPFGPLAEVSERSISR
jgi:hypothetical protein